MATLYPTDQERRAIQRRAKGGDESARNYLELLDICTQILEASNGITLARGLAGERNDIYGHAIDDALSELMPVIVRVSAGGWESLKYYVPVEVPEDQKRKVSTGSYEIDVQKARERQAENQEYLAAAMRHAAESGEPGAEASVTLQYHQAMLYALMFLHRGTDCACQPDIDALQGVAHELDQQCDAYMTDLDSFGVLEMQSFVNVCLIGLARVKNLCEVCRERQQYATLERFRSIHSEKQK